MDDVPLERKPAGPELHHLGHQVRAGLAEQHGAPVVAHGDPADRHPSFGRHQVPFPLEAAEKLEQLRALENGYDIACGVTEDPTIGVDTPEDAVKFEEMLG